MTRSTLDCTEALKHNFLVRGFFKNRGYEDSSELAKHKIAKLPATPATKIFSFDEKIFDKPGTAKLKNEKALNETGKYLEQNQFGLVVVASFLFGEHGCDLPLGGAVSAQYPAWSPDGKRIAYAAKGIRIRDADGAGKEDVPVPYGGAFVIKDQIQPLSIEISKLSSRILTSQPDAAKAVPKAILDGAINPNRRNANGNSTWNANGNSIGSTWSRECRIPPTKRWFSRGSHTSARRRRF